MKCFSGVIGMKMPLKRAFTLPSIRPAFNPPGALLNPVDVKDAVKMVSLMLEDDRCEPAYCVGHGRDLLLIPAKTLPAKLFPAIGP